jgi:hypothetical protein
LAKEEVYRRPAPDETQAWPCAARKTIDGGGGGIFSRLDSDARYFVAK